MSKTTLVSVLAGVYRPFFGQTYWHDKAKTDLYRPLTIASFALDGCLWGREQSGSPKSWGAHLTNLLLHVISTCFIFLWLRKLGGATPAPLLGAAIFAVHPVHAEAVAHVVGRADLLMTLFTIAALSVVTPGLRPARKALRFFAAGLLSLAAMLSKEMGVVVIPLAVILHCVLPALKSSRLRLLVWQSVPLLLALAIYVTARGLVIGKYLDPPRLFAMSAPSQYVAFLNPKPFEVSLTMVYAFGEYLLLCFLPFRLSADYSGFPHALTLTAPVFVSAAAYIGLAIMAWRSWMSGRVWPAFWLAWFLICLFPVSNLLVTTGIIVAERVLYLPSIAACIALAAVLNRVSGMRSGFIVLFLLPAIFGVLTWQRSVLWKSSYGIFSDAVQQSPYVGSIGYSMLSREYLLRLDEDPSLLPEALRLARKSVALQTDRTNVARLAGLLERAGEFEESYRWWSKLTKAVPDDPRYHENAERVRKKLLEKAHPGEGGKGERRSTPQ